LDWGKAASRLESRIDFSRIPKIVAARLRSEPRVYVACSGGADSVFALLLVYLFRSKENAGGELSVLHYNHALRAEESDGDAGFVRELTESLRIPFLDAKAKWSADAGKVSESMAREARLGFFREASAASENAKACIATGHHADDVVETILMRLSRGAGLQGLCVPRELSEAGAGLVFIRPALDFGRDEIQRALSSSGVPWREDSTNASDGNYRARLRRAAVPAWEAAADRAVRPGVGRSRRLLEEDADALEIWADEAWEELWSAKEQGLSRSGLLAYPVALRRRLLARLPGGGGVAAPVVEEVLQVLEGGGGSVLEARRGVFYKVCRNWVRLVENAPREPLAWEPFALPEGAIAYLPDGARVGCRWVEIDRAFAEKLSSGGNENGKSVYLVPGGNSLGDVTVRLRRPGDAFKPHGKSSQKKLKDLFIERKIERRERDALPVFVSEGIGILWVPGLPPNADCILPLGSETALRLTYER